MKREQCCRGMARFLVLATLLCVVGGLAADDPAVRITTSEAMNAATHKVNPQYPPVAKQMNLSGSVELDATIDVDGKVASVKIVKGNPMLTGAAQNALKSWKFKPIQRDGKAVKASAIFAFSFTP